MSLRITIETEESNYFTYLLTVLSSIKPFTKLSNSELSVYAELLLLNHMHRKIPFTERNQLIFNQHNKGTVASKLNISFVRLDAVLSRLRKMGLLDGKELVPKYIIPKVPEVVFVFSEEGDE